MSMKNSFLKLEVLNTNHPNITCLNNSANKEMKAQKRKAQLRAFSLSVVSKEFNYMNKLNY